MFSLGVFEWLAIPALIFCARIIDVTIGTVKIILITRGMRKVSPFLGFIEVLVWVVTIGKVMENLDNPVNYVAYAAGFASGTYVGMLVEDRLAMGTVMVHVITRKDSTDLVNHLRDEGCIATRMHGVGDKGIVSIVFTVVDRSMVPVVLSAIKRFNPLAFYTIEDVRHVSDIGLQSQTNLLQRVRCSVLGKQKRK